MTKRTGRQAGAACWLSGAVLLVTGVVPVAAQAPPPPINRFVVDTRLSVPLYPTGIDLTTALERTQGTLSGHGLGVTVGAHWYPIRWKAITIGVGGELHRSRGSRAPTPKEIMAAATPPPTVQTKLSALSPQLSFNFGSGDGWSYISGGMGRATLAVRDEGQVSSVTDPSARTINYGGGARWFDRRHVAFALDLRIFAMSPVFDDAAALVLPRTTVVVLNFGVAFK